MTKLSLFCCVCRLRVKQRSEMEASLRLYLQWLIIHRQLQ